jgi:hypothetical protein
MPRPTVRRNSAEPKPPVEVEVEHKAKRKPAKKAAKKAE